MTGKSKCPQCGGPGNHPIGSSACKRIEIQRGDKSKILSTVEFEDVITSVLHGTEIERVRAADKFRYCDAQLRTLLKNTADALMNALDACNNHGIGTFGGYATLREAEEVVGK